MRKILIAATVSVAVVAVCSLSTSRAEALPLPPPLSGAAAPLNMVERVALCFYIDGWNGPGCMNADTAIAAAVAGTARVTNVVTTCGKTIAGVMVEKTVAGVIDVTALGLRATSQYNSTEPRSSVLYQFTFPATHLHHCGESVSPTQVFDLTRVCGSTIAAHGRAT